LFSPIHTLVILIWTRKYFPKQTLHFSAQNKDSKLNTDIYSKTPYHTFKSCVVLLQNFYETGENCVVTLIGKLGHQWSIRIKSFDVYGQTDAAGNPVNCFHFVKMYDGRYSSLTFCFYGYAFHFYKALFISGTMLNISICIQFNQTPNFQ